ncbi:hypothetical protein KBI23_07235 [bacterium]|nr:hypothetical protein [bacterium]MBP9809847.1 hypothetical protein [bacterium]
MCAFALVLIGLSVLFCLSLLTCRAAGAYVGPAVVRDISGYRIVFQDYNWKGDDGVIFQVYKGKTKLLERRAHSLFLFDKEKQEESYAAKDTVLIKCADLTGDGVIDLVVQEWNGGAYGCYKYDIYSLGKTFKHIWHHDAVYGHLRLEFPPKRQAQLVVEDTTFCNFKSIAQGSGARPKVYLSWRNGFKVERTSTIAAALASAKKVAAADNSDTGSIAGVDPESAAGACLFVELIYSGQAAKALALLDKLEPGPKQDYLKSFFSTLRTSPFFYEIISLNNESRAAMAKMEKLAQ